MSNNQVFKTIFLGDSGVGKTSICNAYIHNKQHTSDTLTIGIDLFTKDISKYNYTKNKLYIWDTAGQERFRSLISSYYHNVDAAIIVYDVTSYPSFLSITEWLDEIEANCKGTTPSVFIVGCKIDKYKMRRVTYDEGKYYADTNGATYFEVSSNDTLLINQLFDTIITSSNLISDENENIDIRGGNNIKSFFRRLCPI